jgi:hypothetical protein
MIETPRLTLRPWVEDDVPEFIRVTNTPTVMEYIGGVVRRGNAEELLWRLGQGPDASFYWV